jgi:glycosyltransferase involved in cell wall biosynthesis
VVEQDIDEEYEILVVDSSTDGTEKIILRLFPTVTVLHQANKTTPGKARNIGGVKARGEILAFTDSDCIVDKTWLREIVKNLKYNSPIVGGSVENARPENPISRAEHFIEFREFSRYSPEREIRFLASCNFAIKKDIFHSLGGFPEIRASEDTLFAHMLTREGYKIFFDPSIKISHLNRDKLTPYLANQFILGKYGALVRKTVPMPGGFFVKIPYAFPILPLVRTLRTLQFLMQNSLKKAAKQFLDFVMVYPIFLLGAIVWSYGFFCGARMDEKVELDQQFM